MFTLYQSNKTSALIEIMAALMQHDPLPSPFSKEIILIKSSGMAEWIKIELAKRLAISANIDFIFPEIFIWQRFNQFFTDAAHENYYAKEIMIWKLMHLLTKFKNSAIFEPIIAYFQHDFDKQKRYQLAHCVADLFDQYLVYRPDWLAQWEKGLLIAGLGEQQHWQAHLWRALVADTYEINQVKWHRANLTTRFINYLTQNNHSRRPLLPKRVFIFGISSLAPMYLESLYAMSKYCDIHFMLTNPCRHFWGNIPSRSPLIVRTNMMQKRSSLNSTKFYYTNNGTKNSVISMALTSDNPYQINRENPLLASLGMVNRELLHSLANLPEVTEEKIFIKRTEKKGILFNLQYDILETRNCAHNVNINDSVNNLVSSLPKKHILDVNDHSITIRVCHHPQREVEVLYDYLLQQFETQKTLKPRDIIVMVADIDSYTPYIQAVFNNPNNPYPLPFTLSDRKISDTDIIIRAFLQLLDLPKKRFSIEQVFMLLAVNNIGQKFHINKKNLHILQKWISRAGIAWGLDEHHIKQLSLFTIDQYTWQSGIKRVLLGYAIEDKAGLFNNMTPCHLPNEISTKLIGDFCAFIDQLTKWSEKLQVSRTASKWQPIGNALIDQFFINSSDFEENYAVIKQKWQQILYHAEVANYKGNIPITLLYQAFSAYAENNRNTQKFLSGAINFCTFMPMRSIPFEVICLLGMNDKDYPRKTQSFNIDLMTKKRRCGDRDHREEDRYLFLEALVSAQTCFYISYTGYSNHDQRELPATVVSELIEYITHSHYFDVDKDKNHQTQSEHVRQHLIYIHPRTPFSLRNFYNTHPYQSYASSWLNAIKNVEKKSTQPFITQIISPKAAQKINFLDLQQFYQHPLKTFFHKTLNIKLLTQPLPPCLTEPFSIHPLNIYKFNLSLINLLMETDCIKHTFFIMQGAGLLPYGEFGKIFWQKQETKMIALAQHIRLEKTAAYSLPFCLNIENFQLSGTLEQVQSQLLLRWRPAKLTILDGIKLWLEHLIYTLLCPHTDNCSKIYGTDDTVWQFKPLTVDQAQQYLKQYLEGYQAGLLQPLLLFPKSCWSWVKSYFTNRKIVLNGEEKSAVLAHKKFLQVWHGNNELSILGEKEDLYVKRIIHQFTQNEILKQAVLSAQCYLLPLAKYIDKNK